MLLLQALETNNKSYILVMRNISTPKSTWPADGAQLARGVEITGLLPAKSPPVLDWQVRAES